MLSFFSFFALMSFLILLWLFCLVSLLIDSISSLAIVNINPNESLETFKNLYNLSLYQETAGLKGFNSNEESKILKPWLYKVFSKALSNE